MDGRFGEEIERLMEIKGIDLFLFSSGDNGMDSRHKQILF